MGRFGEQWAEMDSGDHKAATHGTFREQKNDERLHATSTVVLNPEYYLYVVEIRPAGARYRH
jgi:hypothetical protein